MTFITIAALATLPSREVLRALSGAQVNWANWAAKWAVTAGLFASLLFCWQPTFDNAMWAALALLALRLILAVFSDRGEAEPLTLAATAFVVIVVGTTTEITALREVAATVRVDSAGIVHGYILPVDVVAVERDCDTVWIMRDYASRRVFEVPSDPAIDAVASRLEKRPITSPYNRHKLMAASWTEENGASRLLALQ